MGHDLRRLMLRSADRPCIAVWGEALTLRRSSRKCDLQFDNFMDTDFVIIYSPSL